jgi:hypothetical protein
MSTILNLERELKLMIGEEEVILLEHNKNKTYYHENITILNLRRCEEEYAETLLDIAVLNISNTPPSEYKKKLKFVNEKKKNYKETKKNLKDAEKSVKISEKRMHESSYKKRQLMLKIGNLKIKIKSLNQETQLKLIEKKEKKVQTQVQKEKRKNPEYYSEEILKKILTLPEELKDIISAYLPYNVRVALVEKQFKLTIATFKSYRRNDIQQQQLEQQQQQQLEQQQQQQLEQQQLEQEGKEMYKHVMFMSFLERIATDPEFLCLLTRDEAYDQIPFLTSYDGRNQYTYCGFTFSKKILKNKILWATEMAKIVNPKFAYKIMKMIIVLGIPYKYKPNFTMFARNELTIEDLPKEYHL